MPPRLRAGLLLIFGLCTIVYGEEAKAKAEYAPLPKDLFETFLQAEQLTKRWNGTGRGKVDYDEDFTEADRQKYKEKVKSMFYHAYDGYLRHAFPADELKPLTCEGHDTWGAFSLTLVDALDTLLVLGNVTEFKRASRLVLEQVRTQEDINVSVFETNIRIVGGLLAAHMLQGRANDTEPGWPCAGKLLQLAHRMGERLLPAFNTATGMPYGTVNLKYGVHKDETPITCTAGVGTMILEFATLTRLTGDERFEKVATRALDSLFKSRSPIGLVGNHISVQSGQWTATDAGIGAGVDSYFEYLVKGALLFRKPRLMKQYYDLEDAILKYVRRGDWFHWVSMASGLTAHDGEMFQSLEAFWPGMLTLIGDVGDAYRILMNYAELLTKYGVPPEFWDIKTGKPKKGRDAYPLRPEVIESMMYLYRATGDRKLLKLAAVMVDSIEELAKTPCGYATVKVRSGTQENRMESFFLAETIKYFYLIFDDDNFLHNSHSGREIKLEGGGSCVVEAGGYIFNTEAHPLDPGIINCCSANKDQDTANLRELFTPQAKTEMVDDLIDNIRQQPKTIKIKVKSISEDAAALTEQAANEYIKRHYGSEELAFEVDKSLAKVEGEKQETGTVPEEAKAEDTVAAAEGAEPRDAAAAAADAEEEETERRRKQQMKEMMEKWEQQEAAKKTEEQRRIERERQFVKVAPPPPAAAAAESGREKRRRQREKEGASIQIELGHWEWAKGEETARERADGVRQIDELKRHARTLVDQRIKRGVNGSKVSLEVLQALQSITEETEPLRRLTNPELTAMLQQRAAVERVRYPEVRCKGCCTLLTLRGASGAHRALLAAIFFAEYRRRHVPFVPGPVCWPDEKPRREDHFMTTIPDVRRYRVHDAAKIVLEYDDEALRRVVVQEWELLAVREQSFLERLLGDGEVLPRRPLNAPMTHERRQELGRERLNEDDELDDTVARGEDKRGGEEKKEEKEKKEEEKKKEERKEEEGAEEKRRKLRRMEEEEWWQRGEGENVEEIVKAVFGARI